MRLVEILVLISGIYRHLQSYEMMHHVDSASIHNIPNKTYINEIENVSSFCVFKV